MARFIPKMTPARMSTHLYETGRDVAIRCAFSPPFARTATTRRKRARTLPAAVLVSPAPVVHTPQRCVLLAAHPVPSAPVPLVLFCSPP